MTSEKVYRILAFGDSLTEVRSKVEMPFDLDLDLDSSRVFILPVFGTIRIR